MVLYRSAEGHGFTREVLKRLYGRVVELVDSLDSGSSVHCGRAGSSPASPTKRASFVRNLLFFLFQQQKAVADEIHTQDAKLRQNVTVMRTLQSQVSQLDCTDPEAAAAVKKFAEELRYSDPVSSPALEEAERDLSAAVANLQSAAMDNDTPAIKQLCRTASLLLTERNRLCKLNK